MLWRFLYFDRQGENTDFRFLYRLVRVSRGPDSSTFEFNPFYTRSEDAGSTYWDLLGGLFGVETRTGGARRFRYLYVFSTRWKE